MKKGLLLLFTLFASTTFAQEVLDVNHRFGATPEDSTKCAENISNYTVQLNNKDYATAYTYWKYVYTNHPIARVDTYTNGIKLLKGLIAQEKDPAKKKEYVNELMSVYDKQLKYLDYLQDITTTKLSEGNIIGRKGYDYITLVSKDSIDVIYDMLSRSMELEKGETEYYITENLMKYSALKYKKDKSHSEQILKDYFNASVYIVEVLDKYNANIERYTQKYEEIGDPRDSVRIEQYGKQIDAAKISRNNIEAYYLNSGAASCEDINANYIDKIESHKDSIEYLNNVISVMSTLKCTDSEAYLAASEYALAIEPNAKAALGCGYRYYKKGEIDKALEYFDMAIEYESSATTKANYCNLVALIYFDRHNYSRARQYALKALSYNSKYGEPYILIAQCYAASPNWSDDDLMNKCTYFLAIDKLNRAKAVDPTVKREADRYIATYKNYVPATSDLFMRGLSKGNKVTIGGWINETTTIQ